MKNLSIFLCFFSLTLSAQYHYVKANNGLIIREKPNKNSKRIGKLEHASSVIILNSTGIKLEVKDGTKTIAGEWVEIENSLGNQKGYVFDGYLTTSQLIKVKFDILTLEIELLAQWNHDESNEIRKDTAYVLIEIGESPENKKIRILESQYEKVEILQQYKNGITVLNDMSYCELTKWKHYYSEWKKLPYSPKTKTFISHTYNHDDWNRFMEVDLDELRAAVQKECGNYWFEIAKDIKRINDDEHCMIGIRQIFFKILLTDNNHNVSERIICFDIPIGC